MKSDDSSGQLTVERIFSTDEFQEERIGTIIWSKLGAAYFALKGFEAENDGQALVRVDAASGTEKVVVPAVICLVPIPVAFASLGADSVTVAAELVRFQYWSTA